MVISEEKLEEILDVHADIDKASSISSSGDRLLTRIPDDLVKEMKIKKGDKVRWLFDIKNQELNIRIEKE